MSDYALVKDGTIISRIIWDGPEVSPMEFDDGVTPVELEPGVFTDIGYLYKDGVFVAPPLTEEQLAAIDAAAKLANINNKDALMNEASQRISVLQDAVDLEMATDEEAAALPLWKKYRVLLSRVDANTAEAIEWPAKPE